MGLKDLKFSSDLIQTPGGNFSVRGLNIDDIRLIMTEQGNEIQALVIKAEELASIQAAGEEPDFSMIIAQALHVAPGLVAAIIACAAGDGGDQDAILAARNLPIDVQLVAIDKIGGLTFATMGGPGKVIEIVMRMARGLKGTAAQLTPSKNGIAG